MALSRIYEAKDNLSTYKHQRLVSLGSYIFKRKLGESEYNYHDHNGRI